MRAALETRFEAPFLIPLAITIASGLMGTTLLVLLLVPAMRGIRADLGARRRRLAGRRPAPARSRGRQSRLPGAV